MTTPREKCYRVHVSPSMLISILEGALDGCGIVGKSDEISGLPLLIEGDTHYSMFAGDARFKEFSGALVRIGDGHHIPVRYVWNWVDEAFEIYPREPGPSDA